MAREPSETEPASPTEDPGMDRLLSDFNTYLDSSANPQSPDAGTPATEAPEVANTPTEPETTPPETAPQGSDGGFFKPYHATAVESLGELLPGVPKKRLEAALEAHGGSVERAANYLLQEGDGARGEESSENDSNNVAETDEEMARRLDRELRGVSGGASVDTDEMLARQLAGLNVGNGEPVGEGDDWRAAAALQRELDGESRAFAHREADELVNFVRDGLAEGVKAEVRERGLVDTQGIKDGVEWGVSGVELVGFSVPESGVRVERMGSAILVAVRDVLMEVRIARWQYRRDGWIPLSDAGKAWVVVSGVSASLRIGRGGYVGNSIGKVEGAVKMKTRDSAVDWLYNAIGVMTKGILGGWIAQVVGDALKRAVLERMQLRELTNQDENNDSPAEQVESPSNPPSTNPGTDGETLDRLVRPLADEGI